MDLEPLEAAVLQKLLDGDHPVLVALRQQLAGLSVKTRELTGAGFFTKLSTASACVRVSTRAGASPFGDVQADIDGLRHGAGFLLYVEHGLLHMLEGFSYDEPWPEHIREFSLTYAHADRTAELAKL